MEDKITIIQVQFPVVELAGQSQFSKVPIKWLHSNCWRAAYFPGFPFLCFPNYSEEKKESWLDDQGGGKVHFLPGHSFITPQRHGRLKRNGSQVFRELRRKTSLLRLPRKQHQFPGTNTLSSFHLFRVLTPRFFVTRHA